MKRILKFVFNYRDEILTISLFAVAGVILVFLFPWHGKFRYEFQKNQPWQHDEYIAPFDFPIYKPDFEINSERDSLLRNFKPYFRYQEDIVQTQLDRFKSSFIKAWADLIKSTSELPDKEFNIHTDTVKRKQYLSLASIL
jgi:hypothetical protein